jgi:hypothetical protein
MLVWTREQMDRAIERARGEDEPGRLRDYGYGRYVVVGSRGDRYAVTRYGPEPHQVGCECIGARYRLLCYHVGLAWLHESLLTDRPPWQSAEDAFAGTATVATAVDDDEDPEDAAGVDAAWEGPRRWIATDETEYADLFGAAAKG